MKTTLLWTFSFIVTVFFALFQRMTGPTYPVKWRGEGLEGTGITSYRLPRSCTTGGRDCIVSLKSKLPVAGELLWRRYRTAGEPARTPMEYKNGRLFAFLPGQPPAGKVEYRVLIETASGEKEVPAAPVVARFKGPVPGWALLPHIVFIFLFMLFSVRIFLSLFFAGLALKRAAALNMGFLLLGGFLFGPVVQHYAFGQAWTGFPLGGDLTDNKTLLMLLAWLPALYFVLKDRKYKPWLAAAFIVTFAVYLVPHSMFGSELDYSSNRVVTGGK